MTNRDTAARSEDYNTARTPGPEAPIDDLIESSSLGTAGARMLRDRGNEISTSAERPAAEPPMSGDATASTQNLFMAAQLKGAGVSRVVFELDGIVYETELTSVEVGRLRATFDEWIAHARRRREPARRAAAVNVHRRTVR